MEDLRVVLEASYTTETRFECVTEYRDEERQRVVKVYKTVPIQEERIRTETVWVDQTETKTVEYKVLVPVKEERTKQFTTTVPVWEEVDDPYTVKVPALKEVQETYTATVPVLKTVEFNYTVEVPVPVTSRVTRTVHNVEPVIRKKTVTECIPVTKTQTVQKDYGHWESRLVEVPSTRYVWRRGRRCCVTTCQTVCERVWVPHVCSETAEVVQEQHKSHEVSYIVYEPRNEQVEYECVAVCYKPETRAGTKQVVEYQQQQLTRTKTVAEYVDEQRSRRRKVLKLREETKTETYPVISYREESRTKEFSYTVKVPETRIHRETVTTHQRVAEDKIETYTARVAVPVVKETEVRVQTMVPKVVSVTINACATHTGSHSHSVQKGSAHHGHIQKGHIQKGHVQKGHVQKSASAPAHEAVPAPPSL